MPDTQLGTSHTWATSLVDYYRHGYSDAEVASAMNITMRQFNQMLTDNPTFAKLVEFGRTLSLAWWESQARLNINNKAFNTPLWVFTMKNKYGWADKVETTNTNDNNNLSLDQLRSEVNKKLKKLYKDNSADIVAAQEVLNPITEDEDDDAAV